MSGGSIDDQDSALRPLRNADPAVTALRAGGLPESEARAAVVQVAAAVEMSLRRLLRDFPGAALQVRLRALAPDELRADEVLAELRQHDQISMELAAAVHDLLEVRQRLRDGGALAPNDSTLAYHVADRLEQEASHPRPAPVPTASAGSDADEDETLPATAIPSSRRRRTGMDTRNMRIALAGAVAIVLVAFGIWWMATPRGEGDLQEGITRFRMGAYEDAAAHFWRYAQANPDDPTARLYLARIHRRLGRYDLAAAQLDTAMEVAAEDADVLSEVGFLLIETGRPGEAVEQFRSALSIDPRSEPAWIGLVTALRADDRADAAERVLQRAPAALRSRLELPADTSTAP